MTGRTSSPRRVLVVSDTRRVWGAERVLMDLAVALARRGVDLTLGAPPGGELEEQWRALGLRFVALEGVDRRGLRGADADTRAGPRQMAGEAASTVRAVRAMASAASDYDVVSSNSLWAHLDCALAGRLARRPTVLDLHDLVRPGLGRTVLKAAVSLSTAAVAISTAVAACVGGRARRRVRVVPVSVDLERFSPGPVPGHIRRRLTADPAAPLVGIVGRIDPEKGVDLVVQAMAALDGPAAQAHLVVVGTGALASPGYAAGVEAEAGRALGERVRFVGRSDDVPGTLRALDVLVNASVAEPFGLSVLEAQASGVAVVATRAGGIPDFVADDDNGLLVPSGDPGALAGALTRLVTDPSLRARLAGRAPGERQGAGHRGPGRRLRGRLPPRRVPGAAWVGVGVMRALVVSKFVPFPDNDGGKQRTLALLTRLARRADVVLCAYDDGTADPKALAALGIDVRSVPWRPTPARALAGLGRTRSVTAGRFYSAALAALVRAAAAEAPVDLLQVEYLQMAPVAIGVPAGRRVIDLHNVESALVRSYARTGRVSAAGVLARVEARALAALERNLLPKFDTVVIVSERERSRLPRGLRDVIVCPNGCDPDGRGAPEASSTPTAAFVATMGWAPNVDAATWLGHEVWPQVLRRCPDARLLLVGRDPAPSVRALASSSIEVSGTVDAVRPYLAQARVAVAPLRSGGGTRLKILEALDAGRPVVATSIALDGLEDLTGRGVVVADDATAFAAELSTLLLDPDGAAEMGRAGHDAVAADHSWDAALAPLLEVVGTP